MIYSRNMLNRGHCQIRSKQVHRASHLDKEEMYDEIQKLKEIIASYSNERRLTQTNVAKLEKEISKKVRIISIFCREYQRVSLYYYQTTDNVASSLPL